MEENTAEQETTNKDIADEETEPTAQSTETEETALKSEPEPELPEIEAGLNGDEDIKSKNVETTETSMDIETEVDKSIEAPKEEISKPRKRKANEAKTSNESTSEDSATDSKESQDILNTSKDDSVNEPSELTMPPKQTLGKGKRARIPNKRYSDILLSPTSRSHSRKSTVENGDKSEKVELENDIFNVKEEELANLPNATSLKSRSNSNSPAPKRPKLVSDVSDPKYLKPFLYGWRRELVFRATQGNTGKCMGDIYYYTPSGKKVRSMREVSENLTPKELTLENFTFAKESLGLDDPQKEIIRDAKPWNKKLGNKSGNKTPKVLSPKIASPKIASPKVGNSPKASKVMSPKAAVAEVPETTTTPKGKAKGSLGSIKVKLRPTKPKQEKKPKAEEEPMEVESPPPKRAAAKKATAATPKASSNVEMEGKPCQPCSIRCQGVLGMVPTLHCRLCLCLYHYECVGLSPHVQIQDYVCKNCRLEHGQNVASSASIVLPPLTPINTLQSLSVQSTASLPTLQRLPRPDSPQQQEAVSTAIATNPLLPPGPKVAKDVPASGAPAPPKTNSQTEMKSLVGSVTSWLPHSSTIQVDSMQRNKENQAPRPQYVEYLAGRKFMIIPKHNVVSVSPTVISRRGSNKQVEKMDSDGGGAVGIDGAKSGEGLVAQREDDACEQKFEKTTDTPAGKRRTTRTNNVSSVDKVEVTKFTDNFLQNISYGYNALLYVFQYLKVQDLLRAGCVCTMWRYVASHPSLWRTVRMKNSQVHSFEGLANSLQKHGTVHLDLRKMLLPTNRTDDEIWSEFSKAIQRVQTLRKIELCRCPPSVVEQLAITNEDLEVVNAVTIKGEHITLDRLSSLKNLKELRLKSASGLILSSDITSLKELTHLTHLSLTSVKDLNKMSLDVIAALKNLESLDLGECNDFPCSFGEDILIKLKKLEKLRLEKGQGDCHTFEILDAVKQMRQLEQLELVNFDIKAGFDMALGACKNIKKLLIIPTYISQSATTNHMVLGGVLRLQSTLSHFVWGVTLELLRVTELFVDQCEDPDKKDKKDKKNSGSGDSIPVLKPVPLITDKNDTIPPAHDPPQVEILPLPNLQKLLLQSLPTTRVKILKIPFHATWRQSITDTVN